MFISEQVNIAIFKTNYSGTYNATNIVKPNVVRITKLGINYINVLSLTIESIAKHKLGIFKF